MAEVDQVIHRRLSSQVALVNQISHYIVNAGGKRVRPMVLLLVARALGCSSSQMHELAAVVEFIHTSTLLHDDVVDESDLRRGRQTANAMFGNAASVAACSSAVARSVGVAAKVAGISSACASRLAAPSWRFRRS